MSSPTVATSATRSTWSTVVNRARSASESRGIGAKKRRYVDSGDCRTWNACSAVGVLRGDRPQVRGAAVGENDVRLPVRRVGRPPESAARSTRPEPNASPASPGPPLSGLRYPLRLVSPAVPSSSAFAEARVAARCPATGAGARVRRHERRLRSPAPPAAVAPRAFRSARDLLLELREDHGAPARASAGRGRSASTTRRDWFDAVAAGPAADRAALWILEADAGEQRLTYARAGRPVAPARRRGCDAQGVAPRRPRAAHARQPGRAVGDDARRDPARRRGHPGDDAARGGRRPGPDRAGQVRHVVARVGRRRRASTASPATGPGSPSARTSTGWLRVRRRRGLRRRARPASTPAATRPLLLYFTSGTTASPKLVEHTHVSYPVGHLSTMYWIGLRPGDVHLNVSSPGWAKHAWSNLFAPWNAEATVLIVNQPRFDAGGLLAAMERCRRHHVLRTADGLADARAAGPRGVGGTDPAARGRRRRRAAQPRGHRAGPAGLGPGGAGRLRPDRDDRPGGQPAGAARACRGRWAGRCPVTTWCWSTPSTATSGRTAPPRARSACGSTPPALGRPLGLMVGYRDDEERTADAMRGGVYHTGDVASRDADGYITYVGRADDVFKASDYRISPFELESVLVEHPAVAEAAVVPSPDPLRLAVPKAVVVLAAGWEPTAETAPAHPRLRARAPGAVQADPADRVRRAAQDDLGEDPAGRAAGRRAAHATPTAPASAPTAGVLGGRPAHLSRALLP